MGAFLTLLLPTDNVLVVQRGKISVPRTRNRHAFFFFYFSREITSSLLRFFFQTEKEWNNMFSLGWWRWCHWTWWKKNLRSARPGKKKKLPSFACVTHTKFTCVSWKSSLIALVRVVLNEFTTRRDTFSSSFVNCQKSLALLNEQVLFQSSFPQKPRRHLTVTGLATEDAHYALNFICYQEEEEPKPLCKSRAATPSRLSLSLFCAF